MAVPTTQWDENAPAGTDSIASGDNEIRTMKQQVREVVAVDHEFTSSQTASTGGQHLQVTLQNQTDVGIGANGTTAIGTQGASGSGQLVYTTESDSDIVIVDTNDKLSFSSISAVANMSVLMEFIYPVGSIYMNASVSTNPGTLLGVGTWTAMVDEVVVGKNSSGTFDTLGTLATGAETVQLSAVESGVAAHTHSIPTSQDNNGGSAAYVQQAQATTTSTITGGAVTGGAAQAASAHNNIQPTYVAYMWRRTA